MRHCSLQLYIQRAADQNRQLEERGSGFDDDVIIVTHHFQQPRDIGQLDLDISLQIFDIFGTFMSRLPGDLSNPSTPL